MIEFQFGKEMSGDKEEVENLVNAIHSDANFRTADIQIVRRGRNIPYDAIHIAQNSKNSLLLPGEKLVLVGYGVYEIKKI